MHLIPRFLPLLLIAGVVRGGSLFVRRGKHTTFQADPTLGQQHDLIPRLYEQCRLKDLNGTVVEERNGCVTQLLALLLGQVRVAPIGYAVAAAQSGPRNMTTALFLSLDGTVPEVHLLPTGYQYFDFTGDAALAGVRVQAFQADAAANIYPEDLVELSNAIADFAGATSEDEVPFFSSDSWDFGVCGRAGNVMWYGRLVLEETEFNATKFEPMTAPPCHVGLPFADTQTPTLIQAPGSVNVTAPSSSTPFQSPPYPMPPGARDRYNTTLSPYNVPYNCAQGMPEAFVNGPHEQ
ncbi:hypothetical protein CKM354_000784000 [Cercospora kikuchii]|uniref:Uncharacterized protein n=1 Tax=Cercospora kikuchii TaxID=84275 RepID=A0A9P3CHS9_9PEZI|nr:uncharacterized protein CKM354_000784000 [Cercospora kikuchii]GIZ44649.1 hypothetical protein CKM354_000784000 [Cercospora kikuchii]